MGSVLFVLIFLNFIFQILIVFFTLCYVTCKAEPQFPFSFNPFLSPFNPTGQTWPVFQPRGPNPFDFVRKVDVIENLELPREKRSAQFTAFNYNPAFRQRGRNAFQNIRQPEPIEDNFEFPQVNEQVDFEQAFDTDFDPPFKPATFKPRISEFRSRSRNSFEKVRKTDVIENLELPREDGDAEEPLKEFEYVPPTYIENRDPPYNVILLTLPKDDVSKEQVESVPVYNRDSKYKFRPSRLSEFGTELFYLQSKKEIEKEEQRRLEGGR